MTVHKAKGLGFDIVVLPDLEGKKLAKARDGLAVHKGADRSVEWVLALPPKLFWKQDEVLAEHMQEAAAEACYEKLALLYVAMTRAKQAMYLITAPVGTSVSQNYPRLLGDALGRKADLIQIGKLEIAGTWSAGQARWYEEHSLTPADTGTPAAKNIPMLNPSRRLVGTVTGGVAHQPSAAKKGILTAAPLFALDRYAAADFGSAVHDLLAQILWRNECADFSEALRRARSGNEAAATEALACLNAPELTSVWVRPVEGVIGEVWRERAFEIVLDGVWITGIFDRVVLARDMSGTVVWATVFDFKTDQVADENDLVALRQRHAPQLEIYRRVVAVLCGMNAKDVKANLVLTRLRRLIAVD
jgi:ATP-dependent helicase/nuclease subunit A